MTVDIYDGPIDRLHQHKSRVGQLPELRMLTDWAPAVDMRPVAVDGLSNLTLCLIYPRICYRPQWWASRQRSFVPVFCCCCLHQSNGLKKKPMNKILNSPPIQQPSLSHVWAYNFSHTHIHICQVRIFPHRIPQSHNHPPSHTQKHTFAKGSAIKVGLISNLKMLIWWKGK